MKKSKESAKETKRKEEESHTIRYMAWIIGLAKVLRMKCYWCDKKGVIRMVTR